jgi:hypothetical protein
MSLITNSKPEKRLNSKEVGPLIRCECGFEILLVPDVDAMAKAIENHAEEHARKERNFAEAAFEKERVYLILTAQVLNLAADS